MTATSGTTSIPGGPKPNARGYQGGKTCSGAEYEFYLDVSFCPLIAEIVSGGYMKGGEERILKT